MGIGGSARGLWLGVLPWTVVVGCGGGTETTHRVVTDRVGGNGGARAGAGGLGRDSGSDQTGGRAEAGGGGTGGGSAGTAGRNATGGVSSGGSGAGGAGGTSTGGADGNATGGAGTGGNAGGTGGTSAGGAASGGAGTGGTVSCVPATNGIESGTWTEVAQIPCNGGPEHAPAFPIREFILEGGGSSGRLKVTWRPFETYIDYSGTYLLSSGGTAISVTTEGGAYVPTDIDRDGTISRCGDELVLRKMWLGTAADAIKPNQPPPPPECGHRFRKQ